MEEFLLGLVTGVGVNLSEVNMQTNYSIMVSMSLVNMSVNMIKKEPSNGLLMIPGYMLGGGITKGIKFMNKPTVDKEMKDKEMKDKQDIVGCVLVSGSILVGVMGIPLLVTWWKSR